MKRKLLWIIWLAVCVLSLTACGRRSTATSSGESLVEGLTATEFKAKIADYDSSPNEWIYKGEKPAIVDFYATWCGPCKRIAPMMGDLAEEFSGKVLFYKVDVDQESELALAFGIQSVPTLLFIPMGRQPSYVKGAHGIGDYRRRIQELLLPTE